MNVYLRATFQVSSVTLTSFRHGGGGVILTPPPLPPTQNEPLKSPPRLGLKGKTRLSWNIADLEFTEVEVADVFQTRCS